MYIHECIHLIIRLTIHLNTPYVIHYIWIHRWIAMRYLPVFQENFHHFMCQSIISLLWRPKQLHPNLRHQYKGTEQFRWYPMMVVFMIGLIGCFTICMSPSMIGSIETVLPSLKLTAKAGKRPWVWHCKDTISWHVPAVPRKKKRHQTKRRSLGMRWGLCTNKKWERMWHVFVVSLCSRL